MSQEHLPKPLVEQTQVSQESRAHGGAVDVREPSHSDRSSVMFVLGVGLGLSQGKGLLRFVQVNRSRQADHHILTPD